MSDSIELAVPAAVSEESEQAAIKAWCEQCRRRIPNFSARHFGLKGAWRLNRAAFGTDLLRAPINVFWAPIWILAQLLAWPIRRAGGEKAAGFLSHLPAGLQTRVQQTVRDKVNQQVIANRPLADELKNLVIDRALDRYIAARQATAEISANIAILLLGLLAFDAFTPGGFGIGQLLAEHLAWYQAVQDFWLGLWFGELWYGWFRPASPWWLTMLGIVTGLSLIAAFAAFSGLISDPLQRLVGLHQRRLRRMIDAIECDLLASTKKGFTISEPYWARLMDGLDWLKLGM